MSGVRGQNQREETESKAQGCCSRNKQTKLSAGNCANLCCCSPNKLAYKSWRLLLGGPSPLIVPNKKLTGRGIQADRNPDKPIQISEWKSEPSRRCLFLLAFLVDAGFPIFLSRLSPCAPLSSCCTEGQRPLFPLRPPRCKNDFPLHWTVPGRLPGKWLSGHRRTLRPTEPVLWRRFFSHSNDKQTWILATHAVWEWGEPLNCKKKKKKQSENSNVWMMRKQGQVSQMREGGITSLLKCVWKHEQHWEETAMCFHPPSTLIPAYQHLCWSVKSVRCFEPLIKAFWGLSEKIALNTRHQCSGRRRRKVKKINK